MYVSGATDSSSGRANWKFATFNEKHHLGFSLVPTAFAYAKLDEYFGKLQKAEIEALQMQGGFGGKFGG